MGDRAEILDQNNQATSDDYALAQMLVERRKLDQAGFERSWRWHQENGQHMNTILTSLGLVSEKDMAEALSGFLDIPLVSANGFPDELPYEEKIHAEFLKETKVLPIDVSEDQVILAMVNPRDTFARSAIELKFHRSVVSRVAVPTELEAAIDRLYGEGKSSIAAIVEGIAGEDGDLDEDAERLKSLASEAPVIRLVNHLIAKAVESRASDVHIEPFEGKLRVRYRVDGLLHEMESPPSRLRHAVISRVKIMARLNIAERRLPQDGRINLVVRGKEIDLRVSTVPTMYGESVVLRILDKSSGILGFEELGFVGDSLEQYLSMLERPNGIVLVTGPTGSGKTTTLYASLLTLNRLDRKILTVEDPIEYQLYGVNQIQVRPQIGLSFASVLRSVLRQDPDILMIGEIRDLETAQIAVQASLTGHLVLSTLHTNSAAATVTRLVDMGVDDYLLTSTLSGVVAQRLVRTLCPKCREPYEALPEVIDRFRLDRHGREAGITLFRPKGCEYCGGSGYYGRTCIIEVLPVDEDIKTLVMKQAGAGAIHACAVKGGMRSIHDDGLRKALAGETTVEEIMRVTREV